MNTYRLILISDNRNEECVEDEIDTFEEAQDRMGYYSGCYNQGREISLLMGDVDDSEIGEEDDISWRIEEVDEDGDVVDSWDYDN